MHWVLINGSPRGARGNTAILLGHLIRGLQAAGHSTEVVHLSLPRSQGAAKEAFRRAERVLVAFPLYTDAMPGIVMELFASLEEFCGRTNNPSLAFLVQSGFPEAGHSRAVERWLELLAKRLGARHLGTIVKGGIEGIAAMPPSMTRSLFQQIEELGRDLGVTGRLDPSKLRRLAGPDRMSRWRLPFFGLLIRMTGAAHWNRELRSNGAFARRFDRPFDITASSDGT